MWQQGAPVKACVLVWNRAGERVLRRAHTAHEGLETSLPREHFSHHISASTANLKGYVCWSVATRGYRHFITTILLPPFYLTFMFFYHSVQVLEAASRGQNHSRRSISVLLR